MSIVAWIFLGLVAGFITSKVVSGDGRGPLMDMVLGVLGALVGGLMFHLVGQTILTGFNLRSVFVSVFGAVTVLAAYHALSGRRSRA